MADEAGKTVREADPEVSEAIDAARYAAQAELSVTTTCPVAWSWSLRRGTFRTRSPPAGCSPR